MTENKAGGGLSLPRAVFLIVLAWWTVSLGSGISSWCFIDLVNLAFHEAGHLFGLGHVCAAHGSSECRPGDIEVTDPYDVMATGPSGPGSRRSCWAKRLSSTGSTGYTTA